MLYRPHSTQSLALYFPHFRGFAKGFDDPDLLEAFPGLSITRKGDGSNGVRMDMAPEAANEDESKENARAEEECALLERAAHYALMMNADLQVGVEMRNKKNHRPTTITCTRIQQHDILF